MPLYPFIVLEVGSAFRVPTFRNYTLVDPQVGSPRDLGVHHWRTPKSRGETHLRVSQNQVTEVKTWKHASGFQL
jgi:hypothetical protein